MIGRVFITALITVFLGTCLIGWYIGKNQIISPEDENIDYKVTSTQGIAVDETPVRQERVITEIVEHHIYDSNEIPDCIVLEDREPTKAYPRYSYITVNDGVLNISDKGCDL